MPIRELSGEARRALNKVIAAQTAQATFASVLNTHLKDNNASELAEMVDVSPQYLSDVRHGRRQVSAAVLERFAEL